MHDYWVSANRLAAVVRGHGVQLAFLCGCRTAAPGIGPLDTLGHRILDASGGDVPCVIATRAELPVDVARYALPRFLQSLPAHGPVTALSMLRAELFEGGEQDWSSFVLLRRPPLQ